MRLRVVDRCAAASLLFVACPLLVFGLTASRTHECKATNQNKKCSHV